MCMKIYSIHYNIHGFCWFRVLMSLQIHFLNIEIDCYSKGFTLKRICYLQNTIYLYKNDSHEQYAEICTSYDFTYLHGGNLQTIGKIQTKDLNVQLRLSNK